MATKNKKAIKLLFALVFVLATALSVVVPKASADTPTCTGGQVPKYDGSMLRCVDPDAPQAGGITYNIDFYNTDKDTRDNGSCDGTANNFHLAPPRVHETIKFYCVSIPDTTLKMDNGTVAGDGSAICPNADNGGYVDKDGKAVCLTGNFGTDNVNYVQNADGSLTTTVTRQTPQCFINGLVNDCENANTPKDCALGKGDPNQNCIIIDVQAIINFAAVGVGIIVTIMLVIGGITYLTAGDNPQRVQQARNIIVNSLIGLVSFLFLYAFLQWIVPGGIF